MNADALELYLSTLRNDVDPLLEQIETYAREQRIPIMEKQSMDVLISLLKIKDATRLLEIGTAIGYSAIRMAQALPGSRIVTVERDAERIALAQAYVKKASLTGQIRLIQGDAREKKDEIEAFAPFDAIVIDAAKGQYRSLFDCCSNMLFPGGIIVTDNVFFRGLVADKKEAPKKFRTIVNRLRDFNRYLASHPDFDTSFYPIGDGLAVSISVKK